MCCKRSLEVFDANLSQSNTHSYTCLTARKTVCYRATKYVKQAKINLPNYSNPDQPLRYQFQAVTRCLMSKLEEKVLFKERTEHLLNIQNLIQRFTTYVREQYLQVLRAENIRPTVRQMR